VDALGDYLLQGTPGLARVALVGLALAAVALAQRAPRVAALAAVAALGCIVAAGHANSADPRALAIAADWTHLAAGATWLGGAALILLVWGPALSDPSGRDVAIREVLPEFGRVALPAFVVVAVAGAVNALVELGAVSDLWDSAYGRVLLVKIGLVAAAAGAAYVHVRLRRTGRPEGSVWRGLRAEVALGAGIVAAAGLLVAFPLPPRQLDAASDSAARASVCDPCPLPQARPDELAVADQAGSLVVAAWVRRQPGLRGTIRTLDFRGRPAPGPIEVPGGSARPCGTGCATFIAPSAGRLAVRVRDRGRSFKAMLPVTWAVGDAAEARGLLERAERTMRGLRSAREYERTASGPGQVAVTRYALQAPDRLSFVTDRGVETIQIARRQWQRTPGEPWRVGPIPGGIPFRTRAWFRWTPYARSVELLGRRAGVAVVAAADPATPVWFRLTINERTGQVLRERLVAPARRIEHRFFGFNGPVDIRPPDNSSRDG
jgi:copper transport protein